MVELKWQVMYRVLDWKDNFAVRKSIEQHSGAYCHVESSGVSVARTVDRIVQILKSRSSPDKAQVPQDQ